MTQIQFLDYDIPNAIVPVISLRPDRVFYVYDDTDVSKEQLERLTRVVRKYLPSTELRFCKVNRYRFSVIVAELKKIVESLEESERSQGLYFDITGGTEIMTACGMMLCREIDGARAIYTHLGKGEIFEIYSGQKLCDVRHLSLEDYFLVSGTKLRGASHAVPGEDMFPAVKEAAEWVFAHPQNWHAYSGTLMNRFNYDRWFEMPEKVSSSAGKFSSKAATDVFVKTGFLLKKDGKYRYASDAARSYLTTYGIWLEMYTYIRALEYFDEVYLGCQIDWNAADGKDVNGSEIDVVAMRHSELWFFSCKMAMPKQEDLCEVGYLAGLLGGDHAHGVMVTNHSFSEAERRSANGIYTKITDYKLGRILTGDLIKKPMEELVR